MERNTTIPQSAPLTALSGPRPFCPRCGHFPRWRGNPPFTQRGLIIGITGTSGSGKTTLLALIQEAGGTVLDCDAIYHRLLEEDTALLTAIDRRFPGCVEDGRLDRKKLGAVVFSDSAALEELNAITHTAVKAAVYKALEEKPALAAIDAIALLESGLKDLCDVTVAVCAPEKDRITRLMTRDNITADYAKKRIAAQKPDSWFRNRCDYCLENNDTPEQFRHKCLAFLHGLGIIKA